MSIQNRYEFVFSLMLLTATQMVTRTQAICHALILKPVKA